MICGYGASPRRMEVPAARLWRFLIEPLHEPGHLRLSENFPVWQPSSVRRVFHPKGSSPTLCSSRSSFGVPTPILLGCLPVRIHLEYAGDNHRAQRKSPGAGLASKQAYTGLVKTSIYIYLLELATTTEIRRMRVGRSFPNPKFGDPLYEMTQQGA
ncbi:predicted protein [Histoplasma capsulatum var. duboisii H88]|uniref:Predicted protein n=1 Tax=Ajellomyces capsulatus (strain H88) TaxID=544711 RepID=F0UEC4_AJEC8|nr:predicted protein [Histoplasma capsulatum var. duboisii H88]